MRGIAHRRHVGSLGAGAAIALSAGWNAVLTQTGSSVVATNAFYNGSVAPGASVSFGFQGTWTSNDADPVAYTLNGSPCSIG